MLIDASFNHITGAVIQSAVAVHKAFGPGLLESCYRECLQHDLGERGLRFKIEQAVPIVYGRLTIPAAYRIDLIVEDLIVVEVKAVERLVPIHAAQVLTYLRLTNSPAGLLINFNVPKLMDGVKRIINPYCTRPPVASPE